MNKRRWEFFQIAFDSWIRVTAIVAADVLTRLFVPKSR